MYLRFVAGFAFRLGAICSIAAVAVVMSLAPSRAVERPEQRQQAAKTAAHPSKAVRARRSVHRRSASAKAPRQYWRTGFDDPPYGGWDDDQSQDFGVSLGNGCWDLPQYARLYGCDRNDFNW
jgi:hypothetical protein